MLAPAPEKTKNKAYFKSIANHCAKFRGGHTPTSIIQSSVTIGLFALALSALYLSATNGAWLLYAALLLPTSGLLVRIFIIQHDCGHGSYFPKKSFNTLLGRAMSVLTWTPYSFWRKTHNMHHASSGNLDRRGYGGVETLTVNEFKSLSPAKKRFYRLYRNAYIMLGLGTPFFIILMQRFVVTEPFLPEFSKTANLKDYWKSIMGLNAALLVTFGTVGAIIGFGTLATIYLPILFLTAIIGGWLFFVQHQFEETHWENEGNWSYNEAALMGSSYYDLPKILQWFTGNIGIHHIHHLNAAIPNYRLQECLDAHPDLSSMNRLTLKESLKSIPLALWDEDNKKMVSFADLQNNEEIAIAAE